MEKFLDLFTGKTKPKLGPAKNAEMNQILEKAVEGVYAAKPKTLKANVGRIQTHIRRLEKEEDTTGVRAPRLYWLKQAEQALQMLAAEAAPAPAAPAPAAPAPAAPAPAAKPVPLAAPVAPAPAAKPVPLAPPVAPAPAAVPPPVEGQLYPAVTKKTRTDGDCFYSSIYRASNEQGALQLFNTCLGIDTTSEDSFILSFRQRIATEILSNNLPTEDLGEGRSLNTYDVLLQDDPATYRAKLRAFPAWFSKEFINQEAIGLREHFLERLAFHSGSSYKDVGEIEVKIVQRLLEQCPITLDIIVDTPVALMKIRGGNPVITLQNQGESHYEYFSFIPLPPKAKPASRKAKGGRRSRKTRRSRR